MADRYETVIVGGGHAGLALAYHLGRLGCPHAALVGTPEQVAVGRS